MPAGDPRHAPGAGRGSSRAAQVAGRQVEDAHGDELREGLDDTLPARPDRAAA
ncbi:hypothetical protein [Geodermatophilus sp. DSM 45219]|uniref:hypothetical protein n=1 Tax=Geodermatophilus sp. DSM 45219 TaxID=1881103 RepID=UPI0015A4E894|nr:hypothetical protein [Geodermatophilus sp. DSM 45219]